MIEVLVNAIVVIILQNVKYQISTLYVHLKLRPCYTFTVSQIKKIKTSVLPTQKGFPGESPSEAEPAQ